VADIVGYSRLMGEDEAGTVRGGRNRDLHPVTIFNDPKNGG
jgi:hypothetical protein